MTSVPEPAPGGPAAPLDPLRAPAPAIDHATAAAVVAERFGIAGRVSRLGGERDQNLRIDADDGRVFVLKLSNPADDAEVLDLQAKALAHLVRQDPDLPVMRPLATVDGSDWATLADDGARTIHARLFTYVPGRTAAAEDLDHDALHDLGAVVARTGRALRGFFHPAARYRILWDLRHTAHLRPLLDTVEDPERRRLATTIVDRYAAMVTPRFDGLRAQVIHNDLTLDNVLVGDDDRVSGIVDVGDLTHTALVCDLAVTLAGVMWRRDDPLDAGGAVVAGYAGVTPLEDDEAALLFDLVTARLTAWGVIAAWRVREHPDNAAYITSGEDDAWDLLARLAALGPDTVGRTLRAAAAAGGRVPRSRTVRGRAATSDLLRRRREVLGASPLSYDQPLHLVAGDGVWLSDPSGRRYLDAYNNVPVVGHAHPAVAAAIADQARTLASNTRYLHEAPVALAERLTASLPDGLDTVVFVNSGSEANDLAWRIATAATGRAGAVVTDHAYHGVTAATTDLSPEVWPDGTRPRHVRTVRPPPPLGRHVSADACPDLETAVAALAADGSGLAALVVDPALTSDGILSPAAGTLPAWCDAARDSGGIVVVDEVQVGHGRCGDHLWSFAAAGVVPDVVTLGKPMGNGHPVAAVVTRAEVADALMRRSEVFSTFGGNPVSCAAALTVLDVIDAEGLLARAAGTAAC